uniref:Candidate secreted effector n=1 Tax=Meloidogyne incognita TaxID=6306 RepID=A0A914LK38_MELIC
MAPPKTTNIVEYNEFSPDFDVITMKCPSVENDEVPISGENSRFRDSSQFRMRDSGNELDSRRMQNSSFHSGHSRKRAGCKAD